MKDQVVLDTTAILTLLAMDEGHEVIAENLENAVVSSVTLSEVITILVRRGLKHEDVAQSLKDTFPQVEAFNAEQAVIAASFVEGGLSFGDRACLALAKYYGSPILTANNIWKQLDLGIELKSII